ncbi:MAG TPA: RHS repeat protein, partial [Hadesarchaea archaeon]|nr:RHS repeat protein [Hadesarchaea archaeon]
STTDARGNTTTTEYDLTRHLFPVRVTNPLGHAQTSAHDLATGQLLSQTDFNGVTTSYEYDGFGRLLKVIGPGDTPANPTKSFTYDLSSRPAKTVVQTRSTHGASQTSIAYVFFDGFGRVVQTRHQAEDTGQQVVECWGFNQLGKVEHEWLPYLAPTSSSYSPSDPSKPKIRYEYDVTGRVVKMTYPDGTSVTSAHSDWTTTTTDAKGNSIRKTYDAYGRLVKIEEFNLGDVYTTTYSYDAMGNLVQIVDAKGNITTMTYDTLGRRISLDDPDMGEWLYWYDANGNLTGERDAKGEMISYTYDALNRLVRKSYPSGQDVEYEYDSPTVPYSIGRRTTVIDASGSTTFYYDELGREIKTVKSIDGTDYVIERSFDSAGRLTSVEYPDGEVVCYAYNPAGLVEAVVGDEVYVRRVDYDAQGRITSIEYGNGIRTTKSYDALRLLTLRTNGGAFQDFSYEYDAAGNITKLVDHLHGAEKTFGYDNLNRLTYAAGPYGIQYYAYDEIGNLICKDGINYEYGQAGEKPHAVTAGSDGFTAGYDPNGNMIWRRDHNGVTSYTYDFEDRLVGVEREGRSVVEFVYDGAGGRVKKITPLVSRIYIGNLYEVDNLGRTAKHVFLGTQRIATVEDGSTHFYHTDHLGSANAVTDERGNLVQLIEHEPFGSIAVSSGSGEVRYRFMGRESDDETGLVYFGARYYDPVLGRFITADPLVQSLEDPQLLNRYTFCRNNPLVFQEAQGNFFWAAVAIVSIAVTVASFVSPSFNAWMHRTFGDFAAPIQTAAMVVSTFAIAGPVLSVQSAGATFAEAVAAAQAPATAAAAATAVLDTGEGRQFISWLANEVFDDAFGMSPKVAYVSASVVAHAGTSCAFESMFTKMFAPKGPLRRAGEASQTEVEEFAKTHPGGTAGGRPYVEPDISRLGERPGKWTRLVNESGEVAAYHWSGPIWDVPILRRVVKHHQFYAPGMSQGFVPASWSYGTFGVCQQLTPKGYSSSIVSLGLADTGVFVTSLVYGQYGGGLLSRIYWAQEAASD